MVRLLELRERLALGAGHVGAGEFVRLALEEAGADYVDVARKGKRGMAAMQRFLDGKKRPPRSPSAKKSP